MNADLHLESASVALTPGGGGDAGGPPLAEEACPASPPAAPSGSSGSGGFSYDEVFPALPEKEAVPEVSSSSGSLGQWNHRMHVKSSVITQIFHVPSEERRFRETSSQRFGDLGEQAKICADIMRDTQTTIEVSSSRDLSLTVLVTGRERNVALARAHVMRALQTQASGSIQIPKEHHRFILGQKGKNLKELEQTTATKIHVPRTEENSDTITITGSKEGIDLARDHIQKISEEKSKQGVERLQIPRMYHPFVRGPYDNVVRSLEQDHNVRIRLGREEDEITITGEKENVARARDAIMAIYNDRQSRCDSVGVEVKKSQHKYVHGFRGQTLQELFDQTDVWVEVPPMESDVETIVLRGDAQNLGHALSLVYEKANSVKTATIPAKSWMHKYIIGKKGENIKKITQDHKAMHVDFCEDENLIRVEGPVEELELVKAALEENVREIESKMDSVEIKIDPQFHRHIIGKAGANVNRLKQELGVTVHVPSDEARSPVVRVEGPPEGVAQAQAELLDMAHKLQNEVTRELTVEPRFHRYLIGAKGEAIQEVRRQFNQVNVTFPEAGARSDKVLIRGPREDVEACHRHLAQTCRDLQASSHRVDLVLFKQFLRHLTGKGRPTLRRIQQETDTKIELPAENSNSDVVMITGKKENVAAAKEKILEAQKEQADVVEVSIMIPCNLHNSIIGAKGRLIHSIMEDCGRVQITFPQQDSKSDRVTLSGPKEDVDRAKKQLLDLSNEKQLSSFTEEVRAQPKHHRFLIGKNGSNIRKVREKTGARIIFPSDRDESQDTIVLMGKKESVLEAKKLLEEMIENLEKVVEEEMHIDPRHHRHFVARRGEELRQIAEEFGGVQVSFPRSGEHSDLVQLKGARECVDGARKRILEIVQDLESQVTLEVVIPQQHHRALMGTKGHKVQRINQDFNVHVKFPERESRDREPLENGEAAVNGEVAEVAPEEGKVRKEDLILIKGKQEDCEHAREALLALVPVSQEVEVPFKLHRFIIGQKGAGVRRLMEDHDVNISVPPQADESDVLVVSGTPANVASAKEALLQRVEQILEEEEDRKLRSFHLEVEVDNKYHPKIIGWRGTMVSKIRKDHGVQVQFPDKGAPEENVITVVGYEKNAITARDEILRIVKEWEDMVTREVEIDHRIHSRLIGARGRNIRRLMEQHKVEIKFPRPEDTNKDLVQVTGAEEDVEEAVDYLKQFEDEHLEDILDQESYQATRQSGRSAGGTESVWNEVPRSSEGFVVRGGPWEQRAPDTSSTQEFPSFGGGPPIDAVPAKPVPWGPPRR